MYRINCHNPITDARPLGWGWCCSKQSVNQLECSRLQSSLEVTMQRAAGCATEWRVCVATKQKKKVWCSTQVKLTWKSCHPTQFGLICQCQVQALRWGKLCYCLRCTTQQMASIKQMKRLLVVHLPQFEINNVQWNPLHSMVAILGPSSMHRGGSM